jgi:acyl dehydratase
MLDKRLDLDFEYPTYDVCVSRAEQADKLRCCDLDVATFGDYVDITHLATETIMAARHGGVSINGSVHVAQEFDQREPIRLGETLSLSGSVTAIEPGARGEFITCRFEMSRPDGSVPLVLERLSLRADPTKQSGAAVSKPRRSDSNRATPRLALLSRHQLEPDKVAQFSIEAENLIHSDPEVARQFGFDKPIAGGLMSVRYMMAHLWRQGPLATLRMSVRFRRPMFWDDELQLHAAGEDRQQLVMLRGADGKVVNEATVHDVTSL